MKKRSDYYTSELICSSCGNKFPIPRQNSKKREKGHHKHMWCPFCCKKTMFVEPGEAIALEEGS